MNHILGFRGGTAYILGRAAPCNVSVRPTVLLLQARNCKGRWTKKRHTKRAAQDDALALRPTMHHGTHVDLGHSR